MKENSAQNLFELNKPKELENIILGLQIEAGVVQTEIWKRWTLPQNTIGCSRHWEMGQVEGCPQPNEDITSSPTSSLL